MIRHAGHRLARKLKLWQNDVLMRASFWQNISLQALLVQNLKISTLDGAKSPGDFFWTIVILHAQIAHLLKSIIVQACSIIFLRSSFQWGVYHWFTFILTIFPKKFAEKSSSTFNLDFYFWHLLFVVIKWRHGAGRQTRPSKQNKFYNLI